MDQKWIFIFCVVEAALYYKATHSKWIKNGFSSFVLLERHCIIKRHIQNGFPVWAAFMFPTSLLRRETEQEGIKLDRNSNFWGNIICLFNSHSMAASWGPMMILKCMIIFRWAFHGPFNFRSSFVFLYFSGSHQLEAIADKSHSGPCARQVVTFT